MNTKNTENMTIMNITVNMIMKILNTALLKLANTNVGN